MEKSMALSVGVIDIVLGKKGTEALKVAGEIGFDGVEFFVPAPWEDDSFVKAKFQQALKAASEDTGVKIPSLALAYMNSHPLASYQVAQQKRVLDSLLQYIEVAESVSAKMLLLAFYGKGELAFLNQREVLVNQLKAAAPSAEAAGVVLALESTLTSAQYLDIIQRVGSPNVKIYLDMSNPTYWLHNTPEQIRSLGSAIGQIHFKEGTLEGGPGATDLGEGYNDWDGIVAALKEIGYGGWAILETPGGSDPVVRAKKNLAFSRKIAARM